jgi:hypothetical protein
MPYKDKDKQREYHKEYYHKNKPKITANAKKPKRKKKRKAYLKKYTKRKKGFIATGKAKCYRRKRGKYKRRITARLQEHTRLVGNIKKHYGCMSNDCKWSGEFDYAILDLHHCDPKEKVENVSQLLHRSKQAIAREVNKCVVLCANCHRLYHIRNIQSWTTRCSVNDKLMVRKKHGRGFIQ